MTDPAKIICVGVNYRTHQEETGHSTTPAHPTIFTRFADTLIGCRDDAVRPAVSERFDYEGELAVVIGRSTEHVTAAEAWSHVAGVSVFNDLTARDWQRHSPQWTPGKNFPGTGAFGPALVTPDELPDFGTLTLTTRVNGQVRQHAALTDLVFDIPHLIAYISTFTPLTPGDILVTGTPGGVGQFMNPPAFLHPGDVVEIDMPGVGTLRNTVQAH
ncbi:fumarylacetoacetate hydrolase family protein [Streptomyces sp. NPDC057580]|uniref:fumarylacetoacetate hydrolase family protein n=1 Tax=Streptomyces sp. NPDC057580 TaxID=3346173 RepID=UPI003677E31F